MRKAAATFLKAVQEERILMPLSDTDKTYLTKVYNFGAAKHEGQKRANGKPYFTEHCVPVALKLAGLGSDTEMIAAGLLHDTIEDTETSHEEIENLFGARVADLVEGVSKLGAVKYQGNDRHAESLRKFFLSMAKDSGVVVIKLCDRWHNLETLQHLPEEKRQRIAKESIHIYAQLASRLGMGKMVSTINDLAFPHAYPEEYAKTTALLESQLKNEKEILKKVYRDLLAMMTPLLGYQPIIDKRVKSTYSLYKKLQRKDWNIDDVYDLMAFRILVKKQSDCYLVLGAIHNHWRPIPGRVKDYIALPKTNGYQSLHTAIFSGNGPIIEIQVRTEAMHAYNEYGVASHQTYKLMQEGALTSQSVDWLNKLHEFQQSGTEGSEYMNGLLQDLFSDRIFVFTPKGDVIDLAAGSTVLDFAYALHTDIGATAVGAKVNGKYVALNTMLQSEQIVEVATNSKTAPSGKWLDWVTSSHARNKIRRQLADTSS